MVYYWCILVTVAQFIFSNFNRVINCLRGLPGLIIFPFSSLFPAMTQTYRYSKTISMSNFGHDCSRVQNHPRFPRVSNGKRKFDLDCFFPRTGTWYFKSRVNYYLSSLTSQSSLLTKSFLFISYNSLLSGSRVLNWVNIIKKNFPIPVLSRRASNKMKIRIMNDRKMFLTFYSFSLMPDGHECLDAIFSVFNNDVCSQFNFYSFQ